MGCTTSSAAADRKALESFSPNTVETPNTPVQKPSPLSDQEILARIESCAETQKTTFGDIKTRYAWVSQRGYYPDGVLNPHRLVLVVLIQHYHSNSYL